jgi:hypothetical protein
MANSIAARKLGLSAHLVKYRRANDFSQKSNSATSYVRAFVCDTLACIATNGGGVRHKRLLGQ